MNIIFLDKRKDLWYNTIMIDLLKQIISDFHSRNLPEFKKRKLKVPLNLDKIITIIGPRRAGKTWYLFQLITELENAGVKREQILYINFEDERLDFSNNYDLIIQAWLELYPEFSLADLYIFFDEIQELPNWEKYVRRIYDTVTNKIVLTGSNAKLLSKDIATSLRGRSLSYELMPLSFVEFLLFNDVDVKKKYSTKTKSKIKHLFYKYLVWGGYPELVGLEENFKSQILQEYFNVMIYKDLVERYAIKDVSIVKYLIKRMISCFSKEFSVNKLYNELKSKGFSISKDTVYKLVEQIYTIYLLTTIEKYEQSIIKRELTNKKLYLYDNGFVSAVQYLFSDEKGKLLENLVFNFLKSKYKSVFFIKNGFECDFVVFPKENKTMLIQVTDFLHSDNINRELAGLVKSSKKFKNAEMLLLINNKENNLQIPDNIKVKQTYEWILE